MTSLARSRKVDSPYFEFVMVDRSIVGWIDAMKWFVKMVLVAVVLLLPACSQGPTVSNSPSSSPSLSENSSPLLESCLPIMGGGTSRATITDVWSKMIAGHDVVLVNFNGPVPSYTLEVNKDGTQFFDSFRGTSFNVIGHYGFHLQIRNLNLPNTYAHGKDVIIFSREVLEVKVFGASSGTTDIAIGIARPGCPTVTVATGPDQLLIDFIGN